MKYIGRIVEHTLDELLKTKKVTIILGARQVGKTTLIKHVLKDKNVIYLNFDVDIDKQKFMAGKNLSPSDAKISFGNPKILVIDEAQRVSETSRIVKGWYDSEIDLKIIMLGSSSLNILDQSAENLTGRNEKLFLTPFVFSEILSSQSWYSSVFSAEQLQEDFKDQIQTILMQALVFGGYPEAVTTDSKIDYLNNLSSDYLLKDILHLSLVKTPELLKKLLMLLAYQIGSEVSVNELSNNLNISRVTIDRYLDLLEQTFVVFRVPAFSTNPRKEIVKSSKIYFWDTGIRNALLGEFNLNPLRPDIGKLWENWVIAEFAKLNIQTGLRQKLYFWRSKSGSEVDLIVKEGDVVNAYEIKWSKTAKPSRAFTNQYKIPVKIIDHTNPLFV